MRKIKIIPVDEFKKEFKQLKKKYKSIESDVDKLIEELKQNPMLGDELKTGFEHNPRKVRLIIKSKGKGKSGGGRVIYYLDLCIYEDGNRLFLIHIYDKSEFTDVNIDVLKKEIANILKMP